MSRMSRDMSLAAHAGNRFFQVGETLRLRGSPNTPPPPGERPRGDRRPAAPIPCRHVSQRVRGACGSYLAPRGDPSRELTTAGMPCDSGAALGQSPADVRVGGHCGPRRRGGGNRPPLPSHHRRERAPRDHALAPAGCNAPDRSDARVPAVPRPSHGHVDENRAGTRRSSGKISTPN